MVRKYLVVRVCDGAAGQSPIFGGNGANGIWVWKGNSDGDEPNPSWQDCIGANGGSNIVLQGPGNCSGGFTGPTAIWDDVVTAIGQPPISGLRSALLQMPCADLDGNGTNANDQRYTTAIALTAGTGTGVPLTPSVENYVFTI